MWDVSEMPSKLYLNTGHGALVAIRPKFFVEVQTETENTTGTNCIFGFEKAGEGLCYMRVNTYNGPNVLFLSPEDFERYRISGSGEYQPPKCKSSDILRHFGYSWGQFGIKLWYADKGVPTSGEHYFKFRVWIDREGFNAEILPSAVYGPLFRTREECAMSLSRARVIDFEDEAPEPVGVMNTTNGHNPDLVKRINEAWDSHQSWWEFTLIVGALMHRDGSTILEMLGKEIAEYADDEKMVFELGPEYLQIIADDRDLQQILDFIGR